MQRVLDLDLDAFVNGSEDGRTRDDPRLNADVHPPWDLPKVLSFLRRNCRLSGPLPGFAVEHHGDVFFRWRDAIEEGVPDPGFRVTHVDAHADLGTGDRGFDYLLTELLREPPQNRHSPKTGDDGLGDGNYLAFAIANRWISELTYVIGGRYEDFMDYPWQPGPAETIGARAAGPIRMVALARVPSRRAVRPDLPDALAFLHAGSG